MRLQAAPFAGGIGQLEAAGLEAMQKCGFNRRAPGFDLILPAHADMRPGFDCGVTCRCRINQGGTRLADHDAAFDQIIGQCLVDIQLAGGIIDAGHAGAFLGENPLRLHVGLAVAAPLLAGRRRHLALLPLFDIGHGGHGDCVLRRGLILRLCRRFNSRISHWGIPLHEWDQWVCPAATGDRVLARYWSGSPRHHQHQPGRRKAQAAASRWPSRPGTAPSSSRIS